MLLLALPLAKVPHLVARELGVPNAKQAASLPKMYNEPRLILRPVEELPVGAEQAEVVVELLEQGESMFFCTALSRQRPWYVDNEACFSSEGKHVIPVVVSEGYMTCVWRLVDNSTGHNLLAVKREPSASQPQVSGSVCRVRPDRAGKLYVACLPIDEAGVVVPKRPTLLEIHQTLFHTASMSFSRPPALRFVLHATSVDSFPF